MSVFNNRPIGNVKAKNSANFQNWNRDARLIPDDRAWLSEKLLFSKLFSKRPPLTSTDTQSPLFIAIYVNITNIVSLKRPSKVFWRIVYWTKVFQAVKLYHTRLVWHVYSNFENQRNQVLTFPMDETVPPLEKGVPQFWFF